MSFDTNAEMINLQSSAVAAAPQGAHIIVLGNEKGGSGKSTSAMHVAIALLRMGLKVGTIDLDARQATMTRYMSGRFNFITKTHEALPSPLHMAIQKSSAATVETQQEEEKSFLSLALAELGSQCDFVVIDTPGTDSHLSRLAHSYADTLITPMNDSFIDLDLLAKIDPDTHKILEPSIYTQMVIEQNTRKIERDNNALPIRWIVMRNRLSHINAKNKSEIATILDNISHQFGCMIAPGFGERVIFKELFLKGLTLLDLEDDAENALTLSQISARQEVRNLMMLIAPEQFKPLPPVD